MSYIRSTEELYELLSRAGTHRTFSPGEVVFEKGDHGQSMFIVHSGAVALTDGDRLVDTVDAPSLFGEMALIESQPRALTAAAHTDAELVEIPVRTFWVLVHETPYFAHLVMSVMAQRLRRAPPTT